MKRKITVLTLCALLFALCFQAQAQQPKKVPRIGYLPSGPISERVHLWDAFRQGMRELGYVEGQNITLVFPSAEVTPERLPHLAAELVSLKVDVIVAAGTPAVQAAKEATKTIPIVTPITTEPLETGLVASLARPGGNITGLSYMSSDLSGKRLELLREVVPGVSRIAVLSNPSSATVPPMMRKTEVAARALGVQLQRLEVHGPDDFERVFQAATKERAGALITLDDAFAFTQRTRIVKLATKNRLPAIYGFREFVEVGGLMSYAANLSDMYRRAATYVDKILKGTKPADLPVEQPMKFELVINLKTAEQIGLTIPPNVLVRADKVIK
jgi:putative tryptophan/tyrosine transport system substrate-binding protein